MFILTDSQKVVLKISAVSAAGNPAPLEDIIVTSSDESIVTVERAGDVFTLSSTGMVGTSQIAVEADARIGEGVTPLTGTETVQVVAGEAINITLGFGEPEPR